MTNFRIPEVTYPLSISTVGMMLATGTEISVHCQNNGCGRRQQVNLVALARRYGMEMPCMHDDLKPLFHCSACRDRGRPDRNIGFIHHAPDAASRIAARPR